MKRKLIKKYIEIEQELFDIYETPVSSSYQEANLRKRIYELIAKIELLEELLGDEHSRIFKPSYPIIFNIKGEEKFAIGVTKKRKQRKSK